MNFWLSQDKDELEKVLDKRKLPVKGQFYFIKSEHVLFMKVY